MQGFAVLAADMARWQLQLSCSVEVVKAAAVRTRSPSQLFQQLLQTLTIDFSRTRILLLGSQQLPIQLMAPLFGQLQQLQYLNLIYNQLVRL
jgi:hypothetical protein